MGLIEIIPSYDLAAVSNVGNVTQSTIQFANATTGFTTTANATIGSTNTLFVDSVNNKVGIGKTEPTEALDVVGNVAVNTNTLFVDSVNNKVGIGVTEPGATLEVTGNAYVSSNLEVGAANLFVDTVNSRVGIGVTNPAYPLDVHAGGDLILRTMAGTGSGGKLIFGRTLGTGTDQEIRSHAIETYNGSGATNNYMKFQVHNGTGISPFTAREDVLFLRGDGNVGINTVSPASGLHVRNPGGADVASSIIIQPASTQYGRGYAKIEAYPDALVGAGTGLKFYTRTDSGTNFDPASLVTTRMTIKNDGNVGIGLNPISRFNVKQSVDNSPAGSFIISPNGSLTYWGMYITSGNDFMFHQNGADRGYLANGNNVSAIDFTGQHRNFIDGVSHADYGSLEGLIVSANKNKYYDIDENVTTGANAIQISQSLPLVALSNVAHDKACFGVISGVEDPESREYAQGSFVSVVQKQIGDRRAFINSVGEGAIWVTNINGNLESGDYITTSNIAGYGQKQDSDSLKNYTVAKTTMDCDFNPVTQPIQIIKKELQDVNYWVKTTYENVTEEEYSNLTDENRRIVDGIYQKIIKEESKTEQEGYELEVRQELVNVLDEHGQIQWEDDPSGATEKAYKIRYLDADGNITDEANHVYKAAFVGCTYHCG